VFKTSVRDLMDTNIKKLLEGPWLIQICWVFFCLLGLFFITGGSTGILFEVFEAI